MRNLCVLCVLPKQVGKKLLDGMDSYVCEECLKRNKGYYEQSAGRAVKNAPFNPSEVQSLQGYQKCPVYYPYVCEKGHDLNPTTEGLSCDICVFSLRWAYTWTTNGCWKPVGSIDMSGLGGNAERQKQTA